MKQTTGNNSQSGSLDPEKIYFVEKFGYLLKNMDNGFAGPIQEALIERIFLAVDKFRADLPDFVKGLEQKRLVNNAKAMTAKIAEKIDKQQRIIEKKEETAKTDVQKVDSGIIETEIEINLEEPQKTKTQDQAGNKKPTILRPSTILQNVMPKESAKKKTPILRPSAAAIIEENKLRQAKKLQEQKVIKSQDKNDKPLVTRPNFRSKKELTVWERAWRKYGGYTDEVITNLN